MDEVRRRLSDRATPREQLFRILMSRLHPEQNTSTATVLLLAMAVRSMLHDPITQNQHSPLRELRNGLIPLLTILNDYMDAQIFAVNDNDTEDDNPEFN